MLAGLSVSLSVWSCSRTEWQASEGKHEKQDLIGVLIGQSVDPLPATGALCRVTLPTERLVKQLALTYVNMIMIIIIVIIIVIIVIMIEGGREGRGDGWNSDVSTKGLKAMHEANVSTLELEGPWCYH